MDNAKTLSARIMLDTNEAINNANRLKNGLGAVGEGFSEVNSKIQLFKRAISAGLDLNKYSFEHGFKKFSGTQIAKDLAIAEASIKAKNAALKLNNQKKLKNLSLERLRNTAIRLSVKLGLDYDKVLKMKRLQLSKYNIELQRQIVTQSKTSTFLKDNRGALMGIGFAALFGGMALKRVFTSALTSLFQNYKDVMDETSAFNQATNQLSGAWTFFKFTLVDALMQTGLFEAIISFVINLVTQVGEFTSQHPKITAMIIPLLTFGAIFASIMMIAGQVGLALQSLFSLSTDGLKLMTTNTFTFKSGFVTAFKDMFTYVGNYTKSFFDFFTGGMKKTTQNTEKSLGYMAGKFLGFATMGYLFSKLFYEPFNNAIKKVVDYGSTNFYDFLSGMCKAFGDFGKTVGGFFKDFMYSMTHAFSKDSGIRLQVAEASSRMSQVLTNPSVYTGTTKTVFDYIKESKAEREEIDKKVDSLAELGASYLQLKELSKTGMYDVSSQMDNLALELAGKGYTIKDAIDAMDISKNYDKAKATTSTLLSTIGMIGSTGILGSKVGGALGGIGMAFGSGVDVIPNTINDLKTSFETIEPINLENLEMNKDNNMIFKNMDTNIEKLVDNLSPKVIADSVKSYIKTTEEGIRMLSSTE
jgi:hypothetical protein